MAAPRTRRRSRAGWGHARSDLDDCAQSGGRADPASAGPSAGGRRTPGGVRSSVHRVRGDPASLADRARSASGRRPAAGDRDPGRPAAGPAAQARGRSGPGPRSGAAARGQGGGQAPTGGLGRARRHRGRARAQAVVAGRHPAAGPGRDPGCRVDGRAQPASAPGRGGLRVPVSAAASSDSEPDYGSGLGAPAGFRPGGLPRLAVPGQGRRRADRRGSAAARLWRPGRADRVRRSADRRAAAPGGRAGRAGVDRVPAQRCRAGPAGRRAGRALAAAR